MPVSCGEVLRNSTTVGNDLLDCPRDGLVIGSANIMVDLGYTINGIGLGAGVRNDGHASVVVRNGSVHEYDYGVFLGAGTRNNLVEAVRA